MPGPHLFKHWEKVHRDCKNWMIFAEVGAAESDRTE